jgi:hypothetical protein
LSRPVNREGRMAVPLENRLFTTVVTVG